MRQGEAREELLRSEQLSMAPEVCAKPVTSCHKLHLPRHAFRPPLVMSQKEDDGAWLSCPSCGSHYVDFRQADRALF